MRTMVFKRRMIVVKTILKPRSRIMTLLLLLALLFTAGQPIRPISAAAANQAQCTLATLKGRYLFATYGMLLPPAFGVTEPTPGASAGFHIFNGDGTGT